MTIRCGERGSWARVRRTFWFLVAVSVLCVGIISQAVQATPGPIVGLTVAVAGLIAVLTLGLAARILILTSRVTSRQWPDVPHRAWSNARKGRGRG